MADIVLDPCVKSILCGLSQPLRVALQTLLQETRANLAIEIVAVEAKLAQYNIGAAGAQALAHGLQVLLAQAKAASTLVPLNLIAGCVDLGNLNLNIQKDIDRASRDLVALTQDITRVLSVTDELNNLINSYNQILNFISAVLNTIATC